MTCDRCPIALLCLGGYLRIVHCPKCDAITLGRDDSKHIIHLTTVRCYPSAQQQHEVKDINIHTAEHGCYRCEPIANTHDGVRTGSRIIEHVHLAEGDAVFVIAHAYWCKRAGIWQRPDFDEPYKSWAYYGVEPYWLKDNWRVSP